MQELTIAIYGIKSTRKNAKSNYKTWTAYPHSKKFKRRFTPDNIIDMQDWLKINEYSLYQLCVYYNTENLHNCQTHTFYSKESVLKRAKLFADILNAYSIVSRTDEG